MFPTLPSYGSITPGGSGIPAAPGSYDYLRAAAGGRGGLLWAAKDERDDAN